MLPESDHSHPEAARFTMSEFLQKPGQCSAPSRLFKPTIFRIVAALGTGFSLTDVKCNFVDCRCMLFALPSAEVQDWMHFRTAG